MVSSPVSTPAIRTYPHLGTPGAIVCAAVAIVTSSKMLQPKSCRMFSAVGRYDTRVPNSPRSSTMAGAPVCAPGIPESASTAAPSSVPTTMAVSAAISDSSGVPVPPGWSTKIAPVKPSRLTPRLPQSPNWSSRPSDCGTGSASVRPTSEWRSPGTVTKVFSLASAEPVLAATAASLRRNYPDRFGRSAARGPAPRFRGAAASHPLSPVSPSSRVLSSVNSNHLPRRVTNRVGGRAASAAAGRFWADVQCHPERVRVSPSTPMARSPAGLAGERATRLIRPRRRWRVAGPGGASGGRRQASGPRPRGPGGAGTRFGR